MALKVWLSALAVETLSGDAVRLCWHGCLKLVLLLAMVCYGGRNPLAWNLAGRTALKLGPESHNAINAGKYLDAGHSRLLNRSGRYIRTAAPSLSSPAATGCCRFLFAAAVVTRLSLRATVGKHPARSLAC